MLFYRGLFHRRLFNGELFHKWLLYRKFDSENCLGGLLKMPWPRREHPSEARIFLDASHGEAAGTRRRGTAAFQRDRNQPHSRRVRDGRSYVVLLYSRIDL